MFGFEAVNAHHGWSMALLGGTIVFSGLVVLCLAISQLHRFLEIIDRRHSAPAPAADEAAPATEMPDRCPADINTVAGYYQPLIQKLPQPFDLSDLYELARERNFPHPHLTIRCFREAGILVSQGQGQFTWNQA